MRKSTANDQAQIKTLNRHIENGQGNTREVIRHTKPMK